MTTTKKPIVELGPLITVEEPVWIGTARDGVNIYFDPDPMGTAQWSELMRLRQRWDDLKDADVKPESGEELASEMFDTLGGFSIDQESRDAWDRSKPDYGFKTCLRIMVAYSEAVNEGIPS